MSFYGAPCRNTAALLVLGCYVQQHLNVLRRGRRYELHHGVRISDSALVDAAVLSSRYIADRFLPDKAIDLIDESAAKLKMEITSKPLALDEIDRKVRPSNMSRYSDHWSAKVDIHPHTAGGIDQIIYDPSHIRVRVCGSSCSAFSFFRCVPSSIVDIQRASCAVV